MANWKRKIKTGTHRVKIPGTGWLTIKPGQPVLDQNGKSVDCGPECFGSQAENYIQVGGIPITVETEAEKAEAKLPPQAAYVLQKRGAAYWDVVNPANPEKPINDKALRKADAEALLEKLLGEKSEPQEEKEELRVAEAAALLECPYEDDGFGKVFDTFQECDSCAINTQCKAAALGLPASANLEE